MARGRALRIALALAALLSAAAGAADAQALSARTLYLLKCSGCHRADGQGAADAGVPPFPGFVGSLASDPQGRTYMLHVPGVAASNLGDADLARVLNYLLDEWSGEAAGRAAAFSPEEVGRLRAVPVKDIVGYRRALVARLQKSGAPIAEYPWP